MVAVVVVVVALLQDVTVVVIDDGVVEEIVVVLARRMVTDDAMMSDNLGAMAPLTLDITLPSPSVNAATRREGCLFTLCCNAAFAGSAGRSGREVRRSMNLTITLPSLQRT